MADLPDWFAISVMKGLYGTELKTIAVDSQGRIVMLPYGTVTVDGAVDVTQLEKDRWIQGTDGAILRTVLVDSAGRIIMIPRGQSGYYLDVDSNGYLTVRARGVNALGVQKDLLVDDSGRLIAMVKALFGATVKDVQCDTSGNLTLNLKAQDLAEIINRPKYGAAQRIYGATSCPAGAWTSLFTQSGKGMIYGGLVSMQGVGSDVISSMRLYIDGQILMEISYWFLWEYGFRVPFGQPIFLVEYDTTNVRYVANLSYGITFESSVEIKFKSIGGTMDIGYQMYFALV